MENCNEMTKSGCSSACDLKGNVVLEPSPMKCVTDNIDGDKTVEDTNRNITLINSIGKLVLEDQQIPKSSVKGKPTSMGLHVGPNGLVNGLDIGNRPSGSVSHSVDHKPKLNMCDSLNGPSQNVQEKSCTNVIDHNESNKIGRTDRPSDHNSAQPSCSSAPEVSSEVTQTLESCPSSLRENCDEKTSEVSEVEYVSYKSELQMPDIMRLIQKDLSEPYSIYTYRYFIHNWPKLCFLAMDGTTCVGAIVCKLDLHRKVVKRGYIAMLAVDEKYRKRKIGSNLVLKAIRAMVADDADEVVLETEITNRPALRLYENLGFVRDKRLFRYYLNGVDALRLKLWLR